MTPAAKDALGFGYLWRKVGCWVRWMMLVYVTIYSSDICSILFNQDPGWRGWDCFFLAPVSGQCRTFLWTPNPALRFLVYCPGRQLLRQKAFGVGPLNFMVVCSWVKQATNHWIRSSLEFGLQLTAKFHSNQAVHYSSSLSLDKLTNSFQAAQVSQVHEAGWPPMTGSGRYWMKSKCPLNHTFWSCWAIEPIMFPILPIRRPDVASVSCFTTRIFVCDRRWLQHEGLHQFVDMSSEEAKFRLDANHQQRCFVIQPVFHLLLRVNQIPIPGTRPWAAARDRCRPLKRHPTWGEASRIHCDAKSYWTIWHPSLQHQLMFQFASKLQKSIVYAGIA